MKKINFLMVAGIFASLSVVGTVFVVVLNLAYKPITSSVLPVNTNTINNAPPCYYTSSWEVGDTKGHRSTLNMSNPNTDTLIYSTMNKKSTDIILKRYVFDGYTWVPISNPLYTTSTSDTVTLRKRYTETNDFIVAGGWIYKDINGQTKEYVCKNYLRIFNVDVKSFGSKTITYPGHPLYQENFTLNNNNNYIGAVIGAEWRGDNRGALPLNESFWSYQLPNGKYGRAGQLENGIWRGNLYIYHSYEDELPNKLEFTFRAPYFERNKGTGAYSTYTFDNVTIYSRSNPKTAVTEPPSILAPTLINAKSLKKIIIPPRANF